MDALRATDYTFTLTAHAKARGWDAAFGARDVCVSSNQSGRDERDRADISAAGAVVRLVCDTATRAHDHTA
jgi:hypothetical protein